jgi:hypothetical protein
MTDIMIALLPYNLGLALIAYTNTPAWLSMAIGMSGILYEGYKTLIEIGAVQ